MVRYTMSSTKEEPYRIFSEFYDEFIARNCPDLHKKYLKIITTIIADKNLACDSILDATCGTGILMKMMADIGYRITGMDINKHMLLKARTNKLDVFQGDIQNFDTGQRFHIIYSFDSLNHLTQSSEFEATLVSVYKNLDSGGVFIFDCETNEKINRMKKERYSYDSKEYSFIWTNHDVSDGYVDVELKIAKNASYNKEEFVEHHLLRGYEPHGVERLLISAGFKMILFSQEFSGKDGSPSYAARKLTG